MQELKLKRECYVKIIDKREFYLNATHSIVTKKINSLRSIYRRKLKKVIINVKAGAGFDDIHKHSKSINDSCS